jgi:hypothetical protein
MNPNCLSSVDHEAAWGFLEAELKEVAPVVPER